MVPPFRSAQVEVKPVPGQAGRFSNKMHFIEQTILAKMKKKKNAKFLLQLDCERVKRPMNLSIIIQRLKNRYYKGVNNLVDDMKLLLSNCKLIHANDRKIKKRCKKLDKKFHKVLGEMPTGEEVPNQKKDSKRWLRKRQCKAKMRKLLDTAEQLEAEACDLFQDKWWDLYNRLNEKELKTLQDLNAHVLDVLHQCNNEAKQIYEQFKKNLEEHGYGSELCGATLKAGNGMWQCGKIKSKWQDCLNEAIDDIIDRLTETVITCKKKKKKEKQSEDKPNDAAALKETESYSNILLPMLVHSQIINERLCEQINLPESSDDEDMANFVNEEDRLAIQKQFDQLPPESMYEIMHMIEQAEYRSKSNNNRRYNVMHFRAETINLIKKAIDRALRVQNKANQRFMTYAELSRANPGINMNLTFAKRTPQGVTSSSYHQGMTAEQCRKFYQQKFEAKEGDMDVE